MAGSVQAADLSAITRGLESAQALRTAAEDLAENARLLGASENGPVIAFAQAQYRKHHAEVQRLTQVYYFAKAQACAPRLPLLGRFRISFYCPCAVCNGSANSRTASGAPLSVGETIAVDPAVIPFGTRVYIDGIGWRTAQDTGGAIRGNRIDVLVASHAEAYQKGVVAREVYR